MSRPRPLAALSTLMIIGALLLSACGTDQPTPSNSAGAGAGDAFPVTIKHTFGETVIKERPTRVATWGYGSNDAALALGVVPVAMPFTAYGGDKQGILPWNKKKLEELGGKQPTILPNTTELPVEAIAEAAPDVILANYSGITQEEYDLLSKIAPTVAYPGEAWATPWREVLSTTATVLGKEAEGQKLLDDLDAKVSAEAKKHPELEGKTVAAVWDTEEFYVYKPADSRVEFLTSLGLKNAPSVSKLGDDKTTFVYGLSREQTDKLSSDILVFYASDQKEADAFLKKPYAQVMPQIKEKRYAAVVGTELVAAMSPPTVLSLDWGLDSYVDVLSKAAKGRG